MSETVTKLAEARLLIQPILGESRSRIRCALGHDDADSALGGGLVLGALHEVFSRDASASGFTACAAQRARGAKKLLWIVQDFSATEHGALAPAGFAELGVAASDLLLLRAATAEDVLRAGVDALSCGGLGAVILEILGNPKVLDMVASRRLALAAQQKSVTAFLLRQGATSEPSAAQTRWEIRSHRSSTSDDWGMPRFEATLVRNRQGETGHWIMEWNCDDGAFCKPSDQTAHPGFVVRPPADGSLTAAETRLAG